MFKKLLTVAVLALGLTACSSFGDMLFGETTNNQQLAWRKVAGYVYAGIPARNYLSNPNALTGVEDAICNFDNGFYAAMQSAQAVVAAGGDDVSISLSAMSSMLASLNLEIFGNITVPDSPGDIVSRSVVWLQVGTLSAAEMRLWRTTFVQPKIEGFVAEDRDPTADEWDQIVRKATEIHEAIQASCKNENV